MTCGISLLFHDVYRRSPSESGFQGTVADRYKVPVAEFDAALAALDDVCAAQDEAVHCPAIPPASGVLVTVDDGGSSYYDLTADRLEARGRRGCCFVSTAMIGRPGFLNASQIRDLDRRGHLIGSHSVSHPTRFSACSREQMINEWVASRRTLEDLLGHPIDVASLPGGYLSTAVEQSADAARLRVLFTSEPTARIRRRGACQLVGRYTVRRGRPEFLRQIVSPVPIARWREWLVWNGKKVIKPVLGPAYPQLSAWLQSGR
jgi:peptidoglycan/xylan/chitin deacetylase (PgdA/CDA1 family)